MELNLTWLWLLFSAMRTLLAFTILLLVLRWFLRRPRNLPPGPWEFPLLGSLPAIAWGLRKGLQPHHVLGRYAERYGPVFRVSMFNQSVVILDDFESTKAAFWHPQLNDRPSHGHSGVSQSSGEPWIQMRRFSLTVLRGLGIGKSSFEEQIGTEGEELLKEMSVINGKAFNPKPLLSSAVANVISSVALGIRYEYNDRHFKQLLVLLSSIITSTGPGGFVLVFPALTLLPVFKSNLKQLFSDFSQLLSFLTNIINSHRDTLDPHNLKDFIDAYLMEIKINAGTLAGASGELSRTATEERSIYSRLNETNMLYTVSDLFAAGSETTVTTLEWCFLYMAIYPEIQQRVQAEIDAVVGRNRLPRLADKPGLNLTRTVIWEVQRMASIVPLGLPHVAASDTQLQGFLIPKGTILVSNMWRIFRDPKIWPEPEMFKPERFLNDEGKAFKPEEFIPFGVGRRICLGEHLAKMELFIFFSYFMHRFTFMKPADAPPLALEGKISLTFSPLPFEICAVERD
ncbi:cytochrome P450 2J6-like [Acanthaster planci]|uniref:Cytochrome P450 2J6-like n=1 Tax=Acanthaster planci TaxID=133434 RepID=A0A8B8A3R2_ACAPL|nr:cytochrome P450 2J6-like [Acanthaster planci]